MAPVTLATSGETPSAISTPLAVTPPRISWATERRMPTTPWRAAETAGLRGSAFAAVPDAAPVPIPSAGRDSVITRPPRRSLRSAEASSSAGPPSWEGVSASV